jgi:uncharacterized protein (TIGR03067 family)
MNKALLLGCVAVLSFGAAVPSPADEPSQLKWEHKVISFHSASTDEAAKILNQMSDDGWEYVGLLPNDMVAFRRPRATAAEVAVQKDREKMQGTWTTIATELNGQLRAEEKKTEKLTIAGNRWTLKLDGEVSQEGTFKIVENGGKFLKVDFVVTDGFKQGDRWISIVQLDGDKMKWSGCYVSESRFRPTAMTTREGDGFFLRSMKRDK